MATVATTDSAPVGTYEVLASLGQGGMARTYVAVRRGPGGFEQRVCLKRILREHDKDPEFVRQFFAEAKTAASVSHANLVKVLDFGQDAEGHFLALELVPGMDLWRLFSALAARAERLPAEIVTYLAVELATALEVLHRASPDGEHQGLIHRDVSPSNVLISYDGEVKLADFGIARSVDGPKHTRTGVIKGKVPYMAPSYARTAQPNAQCDLFAVGVVLFELLAGQRPYQGPTDLITLELAAQGDHVPLARLAPAAPATLVSIVERLIEPNPELAMQSAHELLTELSALPLSAAAARRQLGQLVESLHPHRDSVFGRRPRAQSASPEEGTIDLALAPTPVADLPAPHAAPGGPSRRALVWLAASMVTGLVVAALVATKLYLGPVDATQTHTDADARHAVVSAVAGDTQRSSQPVADQPPLPAAAIVRGVPEPPPDTHDSANAAEAEPQPRKATLHVSVIPWGEVIVDGRPRGRSPLSVRLTPGTHEITVMRQGSPTHQRVELRAGESRRIMFE